jgi:hypothetical protein
MLDRPIVRVELGVDPAKSLEVVFMLNWIDWETAGFAFANVQHDPQSGEIVRALVYLTSAMRNAGRPLAQQDAPDLRGVLPQGLEPGRACSMAKAIGFFGPNFFENCKR